MELCINKLKPEDWTGAAEAQYLDLSDDWDVRGEHPTLLRLQAGVPVSITVEHTRGDFDTIYFLAESHNKAVYKVFFGNNRFIKQFGGWERHIFPIDEDFAGLSLVPDRDDVLIIKDLAYISEGYPEDILAGVKAEIERYIKPSKVVGRVHAYEGDRELEFYDNWSWLERNVVVQLGDRRYIVKDYRDNIASLGHLYDGETVKEDYEGEVRVFIPVEIGYFQREQELPGITLWYESPISSEKHTSLTPRTMVRRLNPDGSEGNYVMCRNGWLEEWKILINIEARTPELVAEAATAVRHFLNSYVIWVHGNKLWFNWEEPVQDTDPVEGWDLIPRAQYSLRTEVVAERLDRWEEDTGTSNVEVQIQ